MNQADSLKKEDESLMIILNMACDACGKSIGVIQVKKKDVFLHIGTITCAECSKTNRDSNGEIQSSNS